jgi:hypothetical protein
MMVFASLLPLFLVIFLLPAVMGRTLEQSGEFTEAAANAVGRIPELGGPLGQRARADLLFHQFSLLLCSSRSSRRRRWRHTR